MQIKGSLIATRFPKEKIILDLIASRPETSLHANNRSAKTGQRNILIKFCSKLRKRGKIEIYVENGLTEKHEESLNWTSHFRNVVNIREF